jgi:hypothetical protein
MAAGAFLRMIDFCERSAPARAYSFSELSCRFMLRSSASFISATRRSVERRSYVLVLERPSYNSVMSASLSTIDVNLSGGQPGHTGDKRALNS